MIVLPAIDLKSGKGVRLRQGVKTDETVYTDNPVEMARRFEEIGADYIHVVDLDGAFDGVPRNLKLIEEIVDAVGVPVEVGGGIRDRDTAAGYVDAGVARVIIGTKAVEDREFLAWLLEEFGPKVAVSIDAKGDKVAVKGWTEQSGLAVLDFAKDLADMGVETIIYTDISRDGMLTGPNFEMLGRLKEEVPVNIIASGGVKDVSHLKRLEEMDLYGAITGKAVYEGTLDLEGYLKERGE